MNRPEMIRLDFEITRSTTDATWFGKFNMNALWQMAARACFFEPASWASFTVVSITARGERCLVDHIPEKPAALIMPEPMRSTETVMATA